MLSYWSLQVWQENENILDVLIQWPWHYAPSFLWNIAACDWLKQKDNRVLSCPAAQTWQSDELLMLAICFYVV